VLELRGTVASARGGFTIGSKAVLVILPEPGRVLATCEGRDVVARVLQRTQVVVTATPA
jgi:hypothetical protein